jgi:3-hydroxybutyryl-CoA dehydratase
MGRELVAERNVGDEFETGSRIITSAELDMFCTITGNRLDAFLNDETAKAMGFKERVVPGSFIFALVFGLLGERLNGHVHVATDKMKVLAPLYPYDRAKVGIKIIDKKESSKGDRSFVTWAWAVKNQDNVIIAQGENT